MGTKFFKQKHAERKPLSKKTGKSPTSSIDKSLTTPPPCSDGDGSNGEITPRVNIPAAFPPGGGKNKLWEKKGEMGKK